jgi:dTDP-4-amino-4,6-dideoxygalactose transaminase
MIPDMPTADELLPYLHKIDQSQWYTNNGPLVRKLENDLADHFGAQAHVVANGTLALQLLMSEVFDHGFQGVVMPAMTFAGTALAAMRAGLRISYVDVHHSTLQLEPDAIRSSAIAGAVPVASFGTPVPTSRWAKFAEMSDVDVVIDAAGALMTQTIDDSRGIHYAFSLHATKIVGAGEGGVIVSRNPDVMDLVRRSSSFGPRGTNAKMSEYSAAVALASMAGTEKRMERLNALTQEYLIHLPDGFEVLPSGETMMLVLVPKGLTAQKVIHFLAKRGIESKQWYRPFPCEYVTGADPGFDHFPVTKMLAERMVGLPMHTSLSEFDVRRVCSALFGIQESHQ